MKKLLFNIALMAAIVAGCSKENTKNDASHGGEVSLRATISNKSQMVDVTTRASDVTWVVNDRVGVFVFKDGTGESLYSNVQYNIDNVALGVMSAVESKDKIYTPLNGSANYYAYYPYSSDVVKVDGTIYKVDVTDQRDLPKIDLMRAESSTQSTNDVSLAFSHQLVKLTFNLTAGDLDLTTLDGLTVSLSGATTNANFDLKTGEFSNPTTQDITLVVTPTTTSTATITALVAPTLSLAGCKVIFSVGNRVFIWKPLTSAWTSGSSYVYNVTIGKPKVKVGDFYYTDGTWSTAIIGGKTPMGIVFEVNTNGTGGKIVSLDDETESWSLVNYTTNAISSVDGIANMAAITTLDQWDLSYPSFVRADAKNLASTDYSTADIGIWYIAAIDELKALYTAWNGDDTTTPNDAARNSFNKQLIDGIGVPLSSSIYWSSTEASEDNSYTLDFTDGSILNTNSKLLDLKMQCIMRF